MKAISVIIPAYNAEKYIKKCIDSVLNQTFKDFEIVIANDGSKDDTYNIILEYKAKFPDKIKIISQENQGLSATRNNAIKKAQGEYLIFLDSDDYIKPDMLEALYNKALDGNYDIVASDVDCVYPDKTVLVKSGMTEDIKELSLEQKRQMFFGIYPIVCNKIYKRSIFDNEELLFEKGIWFEDVLFLHKLIPNINSIGFVDKSFYQYIQNAGSITYTYSDKLNDINLVMNKILEYYKEKNIFDDFKDELEFMYTRYMLATYIKRISKAKNIRTFKKGVHFAMDAVREKFPEYKKNKYIKKQGLKGYYLKFFNPLIAYLIYFFERNRMN